MLKTSGLSIQLVGVCYLHGDRVHTVGKTEDGGVTNDFEGEGGGGGTGSEEVVENRNVVASVILLELRTNVGKNAETRSL